MLLQNFMLLIKYFLRNFLLSPPKTQQLTYTFHQVLLFLLSNAKWKVESFMLHETTWGHPNSLLLIFFHIHTDKLLINLWTISNATFTPKICTISKIRQFPASKYVIIITCKNLHVTRPDDKNTEKGRSRGNEGLWFYFIVRLKLFSCLWKILACNRCITFEFAYGMMTMNKNCIKLSSNKIISLALWFLWFLFGFCLISFNKKFSSKSNYRHGDLKNLFTIIDIENKILTTIENSARSLLNLIEFCVCMESVFVNQKKQLRVK